MALTEAYIPEELEFLQSQEASDQMRKLIEDALMSLVGQRIYIEGEETLEVDGRKIRIISESRDITNPLTKRTFKEPNVVIEPAEGEVKRNIVIQGGLTINTPLCYQLLAYHALQGDRLIIINSFGYGSSEFEKKDINFHPLTRESSDIDTHAFLAAHAVQIEELLNDPRYKDSNAEILEWIYLGLSLGTLGTTQIPARLLTDKVVEKLNLRVEDSKAATQKMPLGKLGSLQVTVTATRAGVGKAALGVAVEPTRELMQSMFCKGVDIDDKTLDRLVATSFPITGIFPDFALETGNEDPIISGVVTGRRAEMIKAIPIVIIHAKHDPTLPYIQTQKSHQQLLDAGFDSTLINPSTPDTLHVRAPFYGNHLEALEDYYCLQ